MGAGAEVTQPLLADSKDDGTPSQSRDALADEGGLADHSAGLDPPPVAGSDVAHHVPFHPAMRNDEYDKGAHCRCRRHLFSSLSHGLEVCTAERLSHCLLQSLPPHECGMQIMGRAMDPVCRRST